MATKRICDKCGRESYQPRTVLDVAAQTDRVQIIEDTIAGRKVDMCIKCWGNIHSIVRQWLEVSCDQNGMHDRRRCPSGFIGCQNCVV
jgi:hypothetical protein